MLAKGEEIDSVGKHHRWLRCAQFTAPPSLQCSRLHPLRDAAWKTAPLNGRLAFCLVLPVP